MKGVSQILSHSVLMVVTILALGMLVVGVSNFLFETEKSLTTLETNYVFNTIKQNILTVYSIANTSSNFFNGTFEIPISEKIGSKQIYAEFNDNNLTLSTSVKGKKLLLNRDLNIDANLTGSAYFPAKIIIEKINNEITIRLVE